MNDQAVRIEDFEVRDVVGEIVGIPILEGVRHTDEALVLYSSRQARPYYVELGLKLRPTRYVWLVSLLVELLTWSAIAGALFVPQDGGLPEKLTLLTLPTTFAVALLLVREQTSLSARLQRWTRLRLALSLAALWALALLRLELELPGIHS